MSKFFKRYCREIFLLLTIFAICLFFRTFHFRELFQYGHEQDLQAWIIKDILVDHHFRLIGQETSIIGVFIGPIYYYTLAFFFAIGQMSPLSSIIPVTLVALITLGSIFYVFTKLFNKETGFIASFIYSISLPITFLDRWAVPTQPTLLWCVWYLYVIFTFTRGQFFTLPILIILVGLIWHVHIAFIPLLILLPIAIILSRKPIGSFIATFKTKKVLLAVIFAVILTIPFLMFESRHGFTQTQSILSATGEGETVLTGTYKSQIIIENIDRVLTGYLFKDSRLSFSTLYIFPLTLIAFAALIFFLGKTKQLSKQEMLLVYAWIISVFLIHSFSKRPLSEYYFNNLIIVTLLIASLLFTYLYKTKSLKYLAIGLGVFFLINNSYELITKKPLINEYADKTSVVEFIAADMHANGYPCIGITYIGAPGVEYGYRYLLWKNGVNVITPGNDVPVYNLAIPEGISPNEVIKTFGTIGIILPKNFTINPAVCSDANRQLQRLNGFAN